MPPHETAGAGRPTPRNDSAASARIAQPTPNAAETISGGSAFGQQVPRQDARRRGPHRARRPRVVELTDLQDLRPGVPRVARPCRQADRRDHGRGRGRQERRPGRAGGRARESTASPRSRRDSARSTSAAEVSGRRAHGEPDAERHRRRHEADRERDRRRRHDAGEQVAPEVVRPERVRGRRGPAAARRAGSSRRASGEQRRAGGDEPQRPRRRRPRRARSPAIGRPQDPHARRLARRPVAHAGSAAAQRESASERGERASPPPRAAKGRG